MPAPHALYSKMLAERTASRNVFVLFILFIYLPVSNASFWHSIGMALSRLRIQSKAGPASRVAIRSGEAMEPSVEINVNTDRGSATQYVLGQFEVSLQ